MDEAIKYNLFWLNNISIDGIDLLVWK